MKTFGKIFSDIFLTDHSIPYTGFLVLVIAEKLFS